MPRPEVLLPLLVVASAVTVGWWRLSRRAPGLLPPWRPTLALGGLASVAVALLSSLDDLAHARFSAHMVQHMLLLMVAAPLLTLADPLPLFLWGLPRSVRVRVARLLAPGALARTLWRGLTWMPAAWLSYALTLWLWHLPSLYEAALEHRFVHDVEHLMFFWAGLLFWWPIVSPAPRLHRRVGYSPRIAYVLLGEAQHALLGLLLSMSPELLYPFYLGASGLSELSLLEDQAWGGVIMWGTGGVVGLATVMVLLFFLFARETETPLLVKTTETLGHR